MYILLCNNLIHLGGPGIYFYGNNEGFKKIESIYYAPFLPPDSLCTSILLTYLLASSLLGHSPTVWQTDEPPLSGGKTVVTLNVVTHYYQTNWETDEPPLSLNTRRENCGDPKCGHTLLPD